MWHDAASIRYISTFLEKEHVVSSTAGNVDEKYEANKLPNMISKNVYNKCAKVPRFPTK